MTLKNETIDIFNRLGVPEDQLQVQSGLTVTSPVTGEVIATIATQTPEQTNSAINRAHAAHLSWRQVPTPFMLVRHLSKCRNKPTS